MSHTFLTAFHNSYGWKRRRPVHSDMKYDSSKASSPSNSHWKSSEHKAKSAISAPPYHQGPKSRSCLESLLALDLTRLSYGVAWRSLVLWLGILDSNTNSNKVPAYPSYYNCRHIFSNYLDCIDLGSASKEASFYRLVSTSSFPDTKWTHSWVRGTNSE